MLRITILASATLFLWITPSCACSYQRICTSDGCYNALVGCGREDMRRNREDLEDQQDYNAQRGYPRWDERGSRAYRRQRQEDMMRRGDGPGDGPDY